MKKFLLAAALALAPCSAFAADNFAATAGSGLTFAAKDATGVLYTRFIGCDNTTVSQCWAVDASGRLTVNINGTVTVTGAGGTFPITAASGSMAAGSHAAGSGVDGWDLTQGAIADAVVAAGATGSVSAKLRRLTTDLDASKTSLASIDTKASLPLPAQTGIGNVNIGAVQSAGSAYETVAASQTGQALGATGATGDYLSHCVIYPASTSPGVVTVFDNTNAAASNVIAFAGGASSTSNLTPISVPVGAISTAGAWKVTTGANVSVACFGKFT